LLSEKKTAADATQTKDIHCPWFSEKTDQQTLG